MNNVNRMSTAPVKFPRSKRNHSIAKITSVDPGVCAVIASIPMFRGDALKSTNVGFSIEMAETKDRIANKVRARITAYLVPFLAFPRFNGDRTEMDKSYAGEQGLAGSVIPFVQTAVAGAHGASLFHKTQGLHIDPGASYNTAYLEAANIVWNFRATNRSAQITKRALLDDTPLPAFWDAGRWEHLVPDFDDATMDGRVELSYAGPGLLIKGQGGGSTSPVRTNNAHITVKDAEAGASRFLKFKTGNLMGHDGGNIATDLGVRFAGQTGLELDLSPLYAEFQQQGMSLSLANLDMAKKTQAFAAMRAKYEGHDDDYLIDTFFMNGLRLPDQALKQPMLLADQTVTFSQAQRYATDSGNLDEKAVSGFAEGSITLRCPALDVGGIVIVQVEILPDQLWERQPDPFLHATSVAAFPAAMRDFADPEKVDVVTNGEVDADHSDPDGLFGYAPLNFKWNAFPPGIGGKFFKPAAGGGTNVLRQRFWAHEVVDPSLSENFFLCKGLSKSIFLDETTQPFELTMQGNAVLDGLTQFGRALIDATDNYEKVMDQMDQTRVKEGA